MSEKPRTGSVTYVRDKHGSWTFAPGARCVVCKKPKLIDYPGTPICRSCLKRWVDGEIEVVSTSRTETWEIRKVRS